jgi:hypothetical protein
MLHLIVHCLKPNTVKTFSICSSDVGFLSAFFKSQKSLTKLTLHAHNMMPGGYNFKDLYELRLNDFSIMLNGFEGDPSLMNRTLRGQIQFLHHLDLSTSSIRDYTFNIVIKCVHLKSLKLVINELTPKTFSKIFNLTKLQELTIIKNDNDASNDQHIRWFSSVPMTNLLKLEINYPLSLISCTAFLCLSAKIPNIKHIEVTCQIFVPVLKSIITSFKQLETLMIQDFNQLTYSLHEFISFNNDDVNVINENLTKLIWKVPINSCLEVLIALKNYFPNMKQLSYQTSASEPYQEIQRLLTKFNSLKTLDVCNEKDSKFTKDLVQTIKSNKNIQHLSFRIVNFSEKFLVELFKSYFSTIIFKSDQRLLILKR